MHPFRRAYAARSSARWNWWLCTPTSASSVRPPRGRPSSDRYPRSVWTYSSIAWTSTGVPPTPAGVMLRTYGTVLLGMNPHRKRST